MNGSTSDRVCGYPSVHQEGWNLGLLTGRCQVAHGGWWRSCRVREMIAVDRPGLQRGLAIKQDGCIFPPTPPPSQLNVTSLKRLLKSLAKIYFPCYSRILSFIGFITIFSCNLPQGPQRQGHMPFRGKVIRYVSAAWLQVVGAWYLREELDISLTRAFVLVFRSSHPLLVFSDCCKTSIL